MHFKGEFHNSIDAKGRASIPAGFREVLKSAFGEERMMLAKWMEGNLRAYPMETWARIEESYSTLPPGRQREAMFRTIISPAVPVTFDRQGRIQVPQSLRAYAGLEKEIVVVGMGDKIEIWSQLKHAQVSEKDIDSMLESAELSYEIGL